MVKITQIAVFQENGWSTPYQIGALAENIETNNNSDVQTELNKKIALGESNTMPNSRTVLINSGTQRKIQLKSSNRQGGVQTGAGIGFSFTDGVGTEIGCLDTIYNMSNSSAGIRLGSYNNYLQIYSGVNTNSENVYGVNVSNPQVWRAALGVNNGLINEVRAQNSNLGWASCQGTKIGKIAIITIDFYVSSGKTIASDANILRVPTTLTPKTQYLLFGLLRMTASSGFISEQYKLKTDGWITSPNGDIVGGGGHAIFIYQTAQ